ncbi:phosphoribosyltransferase [Candidatus Bathyarchaeota archaeon]|nr:phosphoribosyltransferase [Candidatus Bathyarchaeota archaeon]MCK4701986.1 phosphoribosyltransferase [Candidatus Bathyarchaeota archaeon]
MTNERYLHLTWMDVQRLSEKLADQIAESGFRPDIIVAVSRGGFDPARILSDELNIRSLASLQVIYYAGIRERNDKPQVKYPLNADISGLNVLVVDDVADSGNSLKVVKEYIDSLGPRVVKMATLHHKPWSTFEPDFYAESVDKWIIYPWEPRESIEDIREKLLSEGVPEDELAVKLIEIGFTRKQVRRFLGLKDV